MNKLRLLSPAFLRTAADLCCLVLILMTIGWSLSREGRQPEIQRGRALALIAGRTLDMHDAYQRASAWERFLFRVNGVDPARNREEVIVWFREFAAESNEPDAKSELALLLGAEEPCGSALPSGWFADRAEMVRARKNGAIAILDEIQKRSERRSGRAFRKLTVTHGITASTVIAGGLAFFWLIWSGRRRGEPPFRLFREKVPSPWPGDVGAGTIFRCFVAGIVLILFMTGIVADSMPVRAMCVFLGLTLAVLFSLYLRKPRRSFFESIGLDAGHGWVSRLLLTALALSGASTAGTTFIQWFFERIDKPAHWTEWYNEDLIFGVPALVGALLIARCLFTPLIEEIFFRGLLYSILRRRIGMPVALVASAVIFGLAHGSGLPTLLSISWCGLVWALGYERTGTLWPGILSHAVNNLLYSLSIVVFLH